MRGFIWRKSPRCSNPDANFKESSRAARRPIHAYIPAKDVARARQFYEGKLGFKPKSDTAGGVIYACGGQTACFLYPTPNAGTSRASQAARLGGKPI